MTALRIFVSSVQSEFSQERAALRDYIRGDVLMRQFFDVFLFEDVPASDQRPDRLYLDEVARSDLYVGLFGNDYGTADQDGVSPTEREFDHATQMNVYRLVFLKGTDEGLRDPEMQALIGKAEAGLIRKRFNTPAELTAGLYAALVEYLGHKRAIRAGPFDTTPCADATFDDLDPARMVRFVRTARRARQFPLAEDASPAELLEHLNLMTDGRLTNAAVLLFGTRPQRFLVSSEIKCAHFHGTEVRKPIPSYQVYKGTAFDLVDQAVDFVLSKINRAIGTRAESVQAPTTYEIPKEVVTEAVVNAVAHRDYHDNGSVQVMLFADRLEVRNPGRLPPSLTLESLRVPHGSVPANPMLAESLYLAEYIERMGTGTLDMIHRCTEAGLAEPTFAVADGFVVTVQRPQSQVCRITAYCDRKRWEDVDILAIYPNGTWKRATTDEYGAAQLDLHPRHQPMKVFAAAAGCAACITYDWMPAEHSLSVHLVSLPQGGAVIFPEGTGRLPGLAGKIDLLRDPGNRMCLYASNIAVEGGQPQPVDFVLGEDLHLMDMDGNELLLRIVDITGPSVLMEYRAQSGLPPESRAARSLEERVLGLLAAGPMSKAELSRNLGQKTVSGSLNQAVRRLVARQGIEYVLPDKPGSRLQKYRITAKGQSMAESRPESQPESQPESRPESQPESRPARSLEERVLGLLAAGPMSKAELSRNLGQKTVSGSLNQAVRQLVASQGIERVLPDKPGSRLQKYRITAKGQSVAANLGTRDAGT